MKMIRFRDNLLAQFSVVTFVIMLILALVVALVLIEILDRNVELLKEHDAALRAGEPIRSSDRFSIPNLSRQVSSIKWITFGAIGGSFLYLYLTLVYIVWEGWRTIVRQRVELESSNAVLETRVAERVQDLKEALEQGRRRLDAFQTAAGRLALEDVPERALQRALQDVVDVSRDLVGARYGALAVFDPAGQAAGFVKSGFSAERQAKMDLLPKGLEDLGLVSGHAEQIEIGDEPRYLSVHGFSPDDAPGASFMGAPVKVKDRTAGALYFMGREGEPEFSPDDVRLLNLFALLTGVLLENVGLYDAVAQERRTLAAIQGSMTEGLLVLDPEGRVMYLNETAESLWGLRPPEAQGKPISEVLGPRASNFDPPEALQELLGIAARTNGSPATVEITVVSPLRMHLEVTAFPIPGGGPDGGMTGLLARDVTQEKDLGERRNAFVSIASHELRTPLTSIMGFAEILLKRDLPEALRHDWLERIYQNSVVLSAIVDDMLNLSRIQSGKLALNLEPLSLSAAVNEVLDGIRPGTDKHQFVVDISPDVGQVVADREKLTQILNNLMTNAVKYSPEGGQIKVSARADEDGDLVTVEVADQGMGIAPEHLDQLFSSFARIRRPETEGIKGTGLGLSIVEGLVEMMGGEIWVESELNQGTSLFFSLQTRPIDTEESVVASFRDVGGAYGEKGASG